LRELSAFAREVELFHHERRLQPVRARDGELQVHRLVLEARVLREHAELRVRHLNERLRRERARTREPHEQSPYRHGFS